MQLDAIRTLEAALNYQHTQKTNWKTYVIQHHFQCLELKGGAVVHFHVGALDDCLLKRRHLTIRLRPGTCV